MQNQERRPQSLFCRHCVDTPWLHSSNTYADIIVQMEQKARLEEFIKDIETGSEIQGFTRWCSSCKKNSVISHKYMSALSARVYQLPQQEIPSAFEYYSSMCSIASKTREFQRSVMRV